METQRSQASCLGLMIGQMQPNKAPAKKRKPGKKGYLINSQHIEKVREYIAEKRELETQASQCTMKAIGKKFGVSAFTVHRFLSCGSPGGFTRQQQQTIKRLYKKRFQLLDRIKNEYAVERFAKRIKLDPSEVRVLLRIDYEDFRSHTQSSN